MSGFIEIYKKPVIFDDPEYCNRKDNGCGFKISAENNFHWCFLFNEKLEISEFVKKLAACKKGWKAAKLRQSKPCYECGNARGLDINGNYICPCPHCGDEVPF